MILFTPDEITFEEGEFYTIQGMSGLPSLPENKTVIGQGYNVVATEGTPVITGSVSFQYLTNDVLVEGVDEEQLTIHYWNENKTGWQALDTFRESKYNVASAVSQGTGIYALMAGATIPTVSEMTPHIGISGQQQELTINGSNFLQTMQVKLIGSTTTHLLTVTSSDANTIVATIPSDVEPGEYQVLVVNGDGGQAETTQSFGLYRTYDNARFYDFFESGTGKWQRNGEWNIVQLPDGEYAMTDSPSGSYSNALNATTQRTTTITTTPFSLDDMITPTLHFRHDYVFAKVGDSADTGRVDISTDDGASWHELATYRGGGAYDTTTQLQDTATEWTTVDWEPVTLDLSKYTGTAIVRFSMEVDDIASDKGWIIDDVVVGEGTVPVTSSPSNSVYLPLITR